LKPTVHAEIQQVAAGAFTSVRKYFAAAVTRERAKAIFPSLLVLTVGAIVLLISSIGDVASDRQFVKQTESEALRGQFTFRMQMATRMMGRIAQAVSTAPSLLEGYRSGQADGLAHAASPIFGKIRDNYEVTGLDILDPDLNSIFSSDKPGARGIPVTQQAAREAKLQGRAITRIEAEPGGSYALRLVIPWIVEQKHLGFIVVSATLDRLLADFEQQAKVIVVAVPPAAEGTHQGETLVPALLSKFGGRARKAGDQITRAVMLAPPGYPLNKTVHLGNVPYDLTALALPAGIDGDYAALVAVRDASAREAALSNTLLRLILIWTVCTASFVGACLWLILRLSDSFKDTERDRLGEREQRINAVMDAVVDAIVTIDAKGAILSFNPAAETIFGIPAREALGQNVNMLMPPGLATQHQSYLNRFLATGQRHIIGLKREVMGRRKDGTEFPMDLAISQSTVGGEIIFIGVMRDVTDRKMANDLLLETLRQQKAAQQALRRRSDELVRAAKALTNARDKAEAANDAKSRFLASMSHELRTPMNGILGMAELLARSNMTPEQGKWARMIRESGEALLTLLNDILDLSKIETGRFEIRPAPFDPIALARQLAVGWEHQAQEKGLQLSLDVPAEPMAVRADAVRVRQILTNYLSNALKFTERGFITLKVTATLQPADRVRLRYEVADTGNGVAEENVPRLFEKFPELDIETARQHNGAGLGLAICREIASLMGAQVGVESVLGVGSVFWLEIECEKAAPAAAADEPASASGTGRLAEDRPVRVLVAEDHPVNQKLFQALLGHMGHDVHLVENGREAVEALERESFDVVLLDANMPIMDGAQAARHIRALVSERSKVPLIAVTAEAMVGDRERFLALGMDDYLTKPIDARALAVLIERYARGRDLTESPASVTPAQNADPIPRQARSLS
jgi:PAS domain S-box-containing protein